MDFSEFISRQEVIYSEFRDTSKVEQNGIVPKILNGQGGYIIAYRHSTNIVEIVEELSQRINNSVPSIKYNKDNIHTTLATFQVSDAFTLDQITFNNLIDIVNYCLPLIRDVKIQYNELLMNQDTVILGGNPNIEFFNNVKKIVESSLQEGIQLKYPWGAHITISRFLEEVSNKQMVELLTLVKNSIPLEVSTPTCIDVGYFTVIDNKFEFNTGRRFKL